MDLADVTTSVVDAYVVQTQLVEFQKEEEKRDTTRANNSQPRKQTNSRNPTSTSDTDTPSDTKSDEEAAESRDSPQQSPSLTSTTRLATTTTFTLLTLLLTHQTSKHYGTSEFTSQFRSLCSDASSVLHSTTSWIHAREELSLPVPPFVRRDLTNLTKLLDCLERLDLGPGRDRSTLSALTLGTLSAGAVAAGVGFGGIGFTLAKFGVVGMAAACVYGVAVMGRYAGGVYRESFGDVAGRAERLVGEIEGGAEGRRRGLRMFERGEVVEGEEEVRGVEGVKVLREGSEVRVKQSGAKGSMPMMA
ncbi:hypothetical protein HDV00_011009 [Rhizophlyctis rosea]|nr:hypothetical protein HDV00_011009 [Rhizophlyctis rosea]